MSKIKRLHLGCGYNHLNDYINVDVDPLNEPDLVMDLDNDWDQIIDNSIDKIKCHFVLEHLKDYKHFFKECYRVLKPEGILDVAVPNCLDFTSWQDPTHLKAYFPNSILHISNYKHVHYNTKSTAWNFKSIKTELMFRNNPLNRIFYYFWRILRMDNEAYRFVWASRWILKKI